MENTITTTMTAEEISPAFWDKVISTCGSAGKAVLEKALCLYYAAEDKNTPVWAKGVIYGALAYFILPVDAVPDFLPGVGYSDDLLALAAAFTSVAMCITPEVKRQAQEKLSTWFG